MLPSLSKSGEAGWRAFHLRFRVTALDEAPQDTQSKEKIVSWRKTSIGGLFQRGSGTIAQKAGMTPDQWITQLSVSLNAGLREAGLDRDEP
jgi:hypothetical protein